MAWKVSCVMDERVKFVGEVLDGRQSMTALCSRFGISRKTGYKWLKRYREEGAGGLEDRSRAPHSHPWTTPEAIRDEVIATKKKYREEGPKKLRAMLLQRKPEQRWPAASTMGDILKREGLVEPRRRRQRATPSTQPLRHALSPNDVWSADFKGWFRTGNRKRCTPLTVSDAYTRYFLLCRALTDGTDYAKVRPWFERLFREYGLPRAIRTDNGPPFASTGLGGLTRLAVWWMRLDILPERIQPGCPEQNGRHERLHRTLGQATLKPSAKNARLQQKVFDDYLHYYNHERPHEALGQVTPASCFNASPRPYPKKLPRTPDYPSHLVVRKVKESGCFKWDKKEHYVAPALAGEYIALEPVDDNRHKIYFTTCALAYIDARTGLIKPL